MQTGYTEYGGCRCVPLKSAYALTSDWIEPPLILFDASVVVHLINSRCLSVSLLH